jgi:hypothetical protein
MPGYKRVLLKLSGEALMGDDAFGINPVTIDSMVSEIAQVVNSGVELAIVIFLEELQVVQQAWIEQLLITWVC